MDKRGNYSTVNDTRKIIDVMVSQKNLIMEEIVSKADVLMGKVTEVLGKNGSNIMDITIEEKEEEEGNECFDEYFDD